MEDFFSVSEKNQNLECEGVNVRVLTLDSKARLLLNPVFKLIWRKSTFPLARWLYVAAMRGQIAASSRGADVVHFFGNGPEMLGFAAEAAARKVGAKFVVEPALHEGQWGDKWFDALLYKRAHLLLAHTRYEAGVLERMGMPATKIRTIVHGVDFCDSGDSKRFREKHGVIGPMVLFLGRKTQEKGVGRLLEAWPMVVEKFPEATLVIAGPKSTEFEKLKKRGTTNHTKLHEREEAGPCLDKPSGAAFSNPFTSELARDSENTSLIRSADNPASLPATSHSLPVTAPKVRVLNLDDLAEGEKQDALAACDLLCVPSEGESFGMVYFEAWAYKKPVVALDLPVLRETIGAAKAGILVKNDIEEIVNGICTLLQDKTLACRMGENGYSLAKKSSWANAVESYARAYCD